MGSEIGWRDVDDALGRLERVLRPRVGKRMTALCLRNIVRLREIGATSESVLHAIHLSLDAYSRMDESGAPFPLDVSRVIGARGCRKLSEQNSAAPVDMMKLVATHADALLPAYRDDDVDFAIGVAWKNAQQYLLHLVVGRCFERHDATPSKMLFAAWQAQGAPLVDGRAPIGVVSDEVPCAGVVYAALRDDVDVIFVPDRGDPITLSHVDGLQRFFAKLALRITPTTLAWITHLVRFAFGPLAVVEGTLAAEWAAREAAPGLGAASILLGFRDPPLEERASITFVHAKDRQPIARYAPGELSPIDSRGARFSDTP